MRWKKGLIIFLCSVLAAVAIMFDMPDKSEAKAETYYEDIERFPAAYKEALYKLKAAHPNWTFEVMHTGLDWNDVVYNEMNPAHRSLVPSYFDSSFVGEYYGDGWSCATQKAVEFYLNPVNWLTEDYIFQFELLSYNANAQGIATVQKVLANTFMSGYIQSDPKHNGEYNENGEYQTTYEEIGLTYAQAFQDIGASIGVSPVHLATRVYQEQGAKGSSELISGTYSGYEGYYNYYNIQATGKDHDEIVINGLNEAKSEGWNSRYDALYGGSKKVAERYILRGQDTLYLQKFDVDGTYDGRYWHQYMQNLVAPSNEGRNVKRAYEKAGMLDEAFVFKIPVYNNMPFQDGFAEQDGKYYYYKEGAKVTGEYEIEGIWYYFDTTTGEMALNKVVIIDDKSYCYDEKGQKVIGGISYVDGYWYLCGKDTGEVSRSRYAGDIFNAEDYAKYNPDVVSALGADPDVLLEHWLKYGVYENRRPSQIYNYEYIMTAYGDKFIQYGTSYEAVSGYYAMYGIENGYSGSEEFNIMAYLMCNADLYGLYGTNFDEYFNHYMKFGRNEPRVHTADVNALNEYWMGTTLFEASAYAEKNRDVVNAIGDDPALLFAHWLKYGIYEGRASSYVYDGKYYMSENGDIYNYYNGEYVGAIFHFYNYGMAEFRYGNADFDVMGYALCNADLLEAYIADGQKYYWHYCVYGRAENRKMLRVEEQDLSLVFDAEYYMNANKDIAKLYPGEEGARKHFILYGMKEGRNGNASFNVQAYKNRYKDLQEAYGSNLRFYYFHYINFGHAEGRNCSNE